MDNVLVPGIKILIKDPKQKWAIVEDWKEDGR